MLGFGLGAAFEVGFNCGLEVPALASATADSTTGVSARITGLHGHEPSAGLRRLPQSPQIPHQGQPPCEVIR